MRLHGYCAEHYIHGIIYIGKKRWNAKVRNYNLRGSENDMTKKVLKFIEINKRSGLQLAPLKVMNGSVHGCQVY